ncbi:TPA: restriction endonuclease subunit S [Streptococcus suis]|nr:restriction endonuclease subunit S [Streptococcus suis]
MPNKDKNIPKRRFKAFENADAWELRKLGEVVYRSNITSSSKVLPRLEFEDINSGLGTLNKDIFQKVNDDRKGLEFNEGDVLFGKLRPYLKNWWYAEFNGIALGDFWNLKSDVWHSCFLYTYIQSNAFQLVANDTSGTKMPRSDWNLVAESIAKFPSLPEQKAIGTFFSTLDSQITLHQRKLDKLKNVKQAYLSEMFPAEGERVPKRRFPGFTDAWELRKLRNIFHNIENAFVGIVTPHYVSDGRFYLESNNIKDGQVNYETKVFISEEFYQRQKNKWLRAGDIVMVQSGHVGHSAVIPEELDCSAAHALIMFRKQKVKISSNFLNYQFQTKQSKKKLDLITTGNTIKHILSSEMKEFNAYFPSLPEQSAIGTFFSTLDRQITLHQRKLEKLKNLKKALLNELFV